MSSDDFQFDHDFSECHSLPLSESIHATARELFQTTPRSNTGDDLLQQQLLNPLHPYPTRSARETQAFSSPDDFLLPISPTQFVQDWSIGGQSPSFLLCSATHDPSYSCSDLSYISPSIFPESALNLPGFNYTSIFASSLPPLNGFDDHDSPYSLLSSTTMQQPAVASFATAANVPETKPPQAPGEACTSNPKPDGGSGSVSAKSSSTAVQRAKHRDDMRARRARQRLELSMQGDHSAHADERPRSTKRRTDEQRSKNREYMKAYNARKKLHLTDEQRTKKREYMLAYWARKRVRVVHADHTYYADKTHLTENNAEREGQEELQKPATQAMPLMDCLASAQSLCTLLLPQAQPQLPLLDSLFTGTSVLEKERSATRRLGHANDHAPITDDKT